MIQYYFFDDNITMQIQKSTRKNKKYMATFDDGKSAHFGNVNYQHYKDVTPIKAYSELDHGDPERRRNYWARHAKGSETKTMALLYVRKKYGVQSPAYLAMKYLW